MSLWYYTKFKSSFSHLTVAWPQLEDPHPLVPDSNLKVNKEDLVKLGVVKKSQSNMKIRNKYTTVW